MLKYLTCILFVLISQVCFGQIKTIDVKHLDIAEFEKKIKNAMDSLHVQGMSLAVINNGRVVFNKGFGVSNIQSGKAVTESTFFEVTSLSKPIFAFFALKLAKEGKLHVDKPLYEYLPADNIDDDRYKEITARMVLSHTSGLPNWSEAETMHLLSDPGKEFSYSGEGFVYLSKVIAKLYNTSLKHLDDVFQNEVAKKLDLNNFHFVMTEKIENNLADGYQKGRPVKDERDRTIFDPAGGLYSNTETYAKFLIWIMNENEQYRELFQPVISLKENNPIKEYFGVDSWTLGMAVIKINGESNYWHGGNNLG